MGSLDGEAVDMQRKYLVNVFFIAAIALATFLFFTVPIRAADVRQVYAPSGETQLFVTQDGKVVQMQRRFLEGSEVQSLDWIANDMLVRRHLIKSNNHGIDLYSYYDGSKTWTMTPAEPILRYGEVGSAWEWRGTVTIGDSHYPARMQYRIGPLTSATIEGNEVPVTQVLAYGRIGDQNLVREQLFSPRLGLVKEEIVVSALGEEKTSVTRLANLR